MVLTSDNRLRLYRVTHSLAVAEQTLHVVLGTGTVPQRYGLGLAARGGPGSSPGHLGPGGVAGAAGEAPASTDVVAFAFGPAVGWGLFSLLLMASDGLVYSLGPVAPFGMRCAAALLERLGQEEEAAAEWLEEVFGSDAMQNPSTKNRWPGEYRIGGLREGGCVGHPGGLLAGANGAPSRMAATTQRDAAAQKSGREDMAFMRNGWELPHTGVRSSGWFLASYAFPAHRSATSRGGGRVTGGGGPPQPTCTS